MNRIIRVLSIAVLAAGGMLATNSVFSQAATIFAQEAGCTTGGCQTGNCQNNACADGDCFQSEACQLCATGCCKPGCLKKGCRGCGKQRRSRKCPDCDVCVLELEYTKEKKTCFKVEQKLVCVPKVRLPWQKDCPPGISKTRTVTVLKKHSYECEQCGYKWSVLEPEICETAPQEAPKEASDETETETETKQEAPSVEDPVEQPPFEVDAPKVESIRPNGSGN